MPQLPEHTGDVNQQCQCGTLLGDSASAPASQSRSIGEGKIVGGMEANKHSIPWQGGLTNSWMSSPFCGGTIIGPKTIMTAAHCVINDPNPDHYVVNVGIHDVTNEVERLNGSFVVEAVIPHPLYDPSTMIFDFAILKLKDGIEFSEIANAACLPTDVDELYADEHMVVSGWGNMAGTGYNSDFPNKLQVRQSRLNMHSVLTIEICSTYLNMCFSGAE
jgi:secreted trypsin-like serine protease